MFTGRFSDERVREGELVKGRETGLITGWTSGTEGQVNVDPPSLFMIATQKAASQLDVIHFF